MLPESVITTCVLLGALKPVERWQAMRNFHQSSNIMLDRRIILIEVAAIIVILILASAGSITDSAGVNKR